MTTEINFFFGLAKDSQPVRIPRGILVRVRGFRVKIKQTCSRKLCSSLTSMRIDLSIDVSNRRRMLLKVSFETIKVTEEG